MNNLIKENKMARDMYIASCEKAFVIADNLYKLVFDNCIEILKMYDNTIKGSDWTLIGYGYDDDHYIKTVRLLNESIVVNPYTSEAFMLQIEDNRCLTEILGVLEFLINQIK